MPDKAGIGSMAGALLVIGAALRFIVNLMFPGGRNKQ